MTTEAETLEARFKSLSTELVAVVDAIAATQPRNACGYKEPEIAIRVRGICHELLEAASADGNGGCDLCRS